jgi:signal transduction histidine kinase
MFSGRLRAEGRTRRESPPPQRELLDEVSHELRTPLNAIIGFAQLLAADSLSASQRDSLDQILLGAHHMLAITGRLLESTSTPVEAIRPVELGELLEGVATLCGPLAAEQALEMHVAPSADRCWALCDRAGLTQVLLNLISNAVKYNRPGGSITAGVMPEGDRVRLAISDTGIGIDGTRLGQLFQPFERLDAPQRGIEGTGLGLSLSRTLIESMGGTIEVRSERGRGSTFSVSLRSASPPDVVPTAGDRRHLRRVAPAC